MINEATKDSDIRCVVSALQTNSELEQTINFFIYATDADRVQIINSMTDQEFDFLRRCAKIGLEAGKAIIIHKKQREK